MKKVLILISLFITYSINGQENNKYLSHKLNIFSGVSYQFHNISYCHESDNYEIDIRNSNFLGINFGFSLKPKTEKGIFINYENYLLGEALISEIYNGLKLSDKAEVIVNHTVSSGLFGRLDFGKKVKTNNNKEYLHVGLIIGDKFVSVENSINSQSNSSSNVRAIDGFHITSGLYLNFGKLIILNNLLNINLCLSQSIFNVGETNGDIKYINPLFGEINLKLINNTGIYIKSGTIIMIPYKDYNTKYRFSFSLGYNIYL